MRISTHHKMKIYLQFMIRMRFSNILKVFFKIDYKKTILFRITQKLLRKGNLNLTEFLRVSLNIQSFKIRSILFDALLRRKKTSLKILLLILKVWKKLFNFHMINLKMQTFIILVKNLKAPRVLCFSFNGLVKKM
jgi:hypothetical protein